METQIIICDTNILIEHFKGSEIISNQLKKIGIDSIAISTITTSELYFGALNKKELTQIKTSLSSLTQLPINISISEIFLNLMEKYCLSHKLTIPDAIIAATAIYYDAPLFTLNTKDFRFIPKLKLF
jgi:predicted nucleic acid-binding protein